MCNMLFLQIITTQPNSKQIVAVLKMLKEKNMKKYAC